MQMKGLVLMMLTLVLLTSAAAQKSGVDEIREQAQKLNGSQPGHVIEFSSQINVTHVGNVTIGLFADGQTSFEYISRPQNDSYRRSLD
jgi:endo-1,4-beta-D-glucanase Y